MISVEEARTRICAAIRPLGSEQVGLGEALGRVLAEDAVARVTQPPAAMSAMDGYAVRAADVATVPVRLTVVGEAPAGGAFEGTLRAGEAVRIFTGGPLPAGADSIVIQENVTVEGDKVLVREGTTAGRYVRPAGLDFKAGDVGLPCGRLLTVRDIGLAAAMNLPWLRVTRRPRIAILSTGDEIVMPGEPIGPNQIVGSNGLSLAAFVTACGGTALHLGIAPDDRAALKQMMAGAAGADLLVTSGGASVGEHDLVHGVLREHGMSLDFWQIAMRPGKPVMFGRFGTTAVLGMPGNPVSTLVCALVFLRPVIETMLGQAEPDARTATALLGADLPANDRRQDYLRAELTYDPQRGAVATPFGRQDSAMLRTLAHADCLIVRPPYAEAAAAGTTVAILPFSGGTIGI
ncbi:gephyrin-like molybdotransferase Glp [Rhodospirillaceae bacterium SYSU D60014]|uniref:molybdopterin molybdotransferase MoeA n=1 Tax=Virgifigura deserti TaxID=2268457 RepID=UPI000E66817C